MEFTVADDDWKSESAYWKAEVLFFGGDTFAHIWFWTPYCQSCYIFGWGALPPWNPQQGRCPCTPPGPRRPLDSNLFPFFSKFQSVTHKLSLRVLELHCCMVLHLGTKGYVWKLTKLRECGRKVWMFVTSKFSCSPSPIGLLATPSLSWCIPRLDSVSFSKQFHFDIIIARVALKDALWDFYNLLAAPWTVYNTRSSGPGAIVCKSRATHRALIMCIMLYATWYEGTAKLLSLTELKLHLHGWEIAVILRNFRKTKITKSKFLSFFFLTLFQHVYNVQLDDFRFATYANIAFRHFTALPPAKPPSSFAHAWYKHGPLLDIFLFFSKTKIFHSHPCICFSATFLVEIVKRWRRGGNKSTRRKPRMTSFRKCHILNPQNSSPNWDSNLHSSIGDRLGKQRC